MKETYITICGFNHYYGMMPFKIGTKVKCVKEPDNNYDSEAIKVVMSHIGTVGYVANSVGTVALGCCSAGAVGQIFKNNFWAEVMFITHSKVICRCFEVMDEKSFADSEINGIYFNEEYVVK